ncbi:MAG: hypothetical protein IPF64_15470 [Flavobacteriales bacterium]|nr:hypothetical protein [Flavobacteriales bacterium]
MKKTGPVILITCLIGNTSAQTWDLMETPAAARHYTYYMEVDASESRFVLFARNSSVDSVYTSNGEGNWAGVQHGDFPKAFYADDGSLFLLKDLNPSSSVLQPQVFRSTDNGVTLSEITRRSGQVLLQGRTREHLPVHTHGIQVFNELRRVLYGCCNSLCCDRCCTGWERRPLLWF